MTCFWVVGGGGGGGGGAAFAAAVVGGGGEGAACVVGGVLGVEMIGTAVGVGESLAVGDAAPIVVLADAGVVVVAFGSDRKAPMPQHSSTTAATTPLTISAIRVFLPLAAGSGEAGCTQLGGGGGGTGACPERRSVLLPLRRFVWVGQVVLRVGWCFRAATAGAP